MASPITGSNHQPPGQAAVTARPTSTAGGLRGAQVVLGAFARGGAECSRAPSRWLTQPSIGINTTASAVSRCRSPRSRRGDRRIRYEWIRRHMSRGGRHEAPHHPALARPSAPPSAHPVSATEPTASPCHNPTRALDQHTARLPADRRALAAAVPFGVTVTRTPGHRGAPRSAIASVPVPRLHPTMLTARPERPEPGTRRVPAMETSR